MTKKAVIIVFSLFFLLFGLSLAGSAYFYEKFTPGTSINGIDVSYMSRESASRALSDTIKNSYVLTVTDQDQRSFTISGSEIGLTCDFDSAQFPWQNPLIFPYYLLSKHAYHITGNIAFQKAAVEEIVTNAVKKINESAVAPKDAYLTTYIPGIGYEIANAENGNRLDEAAVLTRVLDKIKTLNTDLTLEEDSYQKATLQASDPALADQANALNHFYDSSVTYDIGDQKVHLTADTYRSWMLPQEDGSFTYDETQLTDYVKKLKSATDTIYTIRPFTTVSGETRSVSGTYGFNLSVKQETAQLASDLLSSQNIEREPLYQSSGAMRAVKDYGNTYLEVDMTNQKVYLWEDGKISFTTDCVTGNTSRQRGTPTGIYAIMYKAKDVVLRGDNYASPVTYWMPFYKGCGFHDASWRGKFGGTIYRYNGSHGCVNLPIPSAKTLYEKVYAGMPVILYY